MHGIMRSNEDSGVQVSLYVNGKVSQRVAEVNGPVEQEDEAQEPDYNQGGSHYYSNGIDRERYDFPWFQTFSYCPTNIVIF